MSVGRGKCQKGRRGETVPTDLALLNGLLDAGLIDGEQGGTGVLLRPVQELVREPGVEAVLVRLLKVRALMSYAVHAVRGRQRSRHAETSKHVSQSQTNQSRVEDRGRQMEPGRRTGAVRGRQSATGSNKSYCEREHEEWKQLREW